MSNSRAFAILVMFLSLSVIGSLLKMPTALGSIALDSAPALVAAALLGSKRGAFVAAFGHLSSAFFAGFQLGLFHLLIAFEMGLLIYLFGVLFQRKWKKTAYCLFFFGNSCLAPLPFAIFISPAFVLSILPSLLIGTAANLIVSLAVIPTLYKAGILYSEKMPHA